MVRAIAEREEVSITQLAARMNIARTTVQYRVTRACKGGWIVNNELMKGKPARLMRGIQLPDDVEALPTVDQLREATRQPDEARPSFDEVVRQVKSPGPAYKSKGHDDLTNKNGEMLSTGQISVATLGGDTNDAWEDF